MITIRGVNLARSRVKCLPFGLFVGFSKFIHSFFLLQLLLSLLVSGQVTESSPPNRYRYAIRAHSSNHCCDPISLSDLSTVTELHHSNFTFHETCISLSTDSFSLLIKMKKKKNRMNFWWAKKSNTTDKENRLNKHKTNSNAAKASIRRWSINRKGVFVLLHNNFLLGVFVTKQFSMHCTSQRSLHWRSPVHQKIANWIRTRKMRNEKFSANEFLRSWKLAFATRICAAASCVSCNKTLEMKQQKLRWGQPNGNKNKMNVRTNDSEKLKKITKKRIKTI